MSDPNENLSRQDVVGASSDLIAALTESASICPLGPGRENHVAEPLLRRLAASPDWLGGPVVDRQMAACCESGLWLLHNFLERSHEISQEIDTATGSYWHGIMHRREPDYSNAKYWFRRVDHHPVFDALPNSIAQISYDCNNATVQGLGEHWDPMAFVDLCQEAAASGGELESVCRQIAQEEWRQLFDFCRLQAVA